MSVSGNVPVSYGVLADGRRGTDQTVQMMSDMAMGQYGARSTKIRALAINILTDANVPEKDYVAEMVAIFNWVRDRIRYTRDVAGQETLLYPEELAFNSKAGDCDDKSMLTAALLGSIGISTRFVTIGTQPGFFSHVFLQAKPRNDWISLDPIMKGKPAGWEAPQKMVKLRKVYPINASSELNMRGRNMNGMRGLGFVADQRTWSFLSPEPAPPPQPSPYVVMDSMLDQDAPIEQISRDMPVFPQQDVDQMRVPRASWNGPRLRTMRNINATVAPRRSAAISTVQDAQTEAAIMEAATNPMNGIGTDLLTPDKLQAIKPGINTMRPDAYMQRPALAQRPDGVDVMFTRPNLIARFDKNDHVVFRGMYALNERPPIRPDNGFAGLHGAQPRVIHPGSALPGMGSLSGPGLAELADEVEAGQAAAAAANTTVVGPSEPSTGKKLAVAAAIVTGVWLLARSLKRN